MTAPARSRPSASKVPAPQPSDKTVERNLSKLEYSASTSRVMNLALVEREIAHDLAAPRIFSSPALNKSIILKHTVRPHERELFAGPRKIATKIVLPFDFEDLKLGGSSVFMRQKDFERDERQFLRIIGADKADLAILNLLDSLPSLDPFLVKERCARAGLAIPLERLSLSPADISAMQGFVYVEVGKLLTAAFSRYNANITEKFVRKILADAPDETMRPLMQTLRMETDEFWDGIFSWRGFLYYKWRLQTMAAPLEELFGAIGSYAPQGPAEPSLMQSIAAVRPRLARKLKSTIANARDIIAVYNEAFAAMVERDDASKFNRFLFDGPKLFIALGEQVGLLDHFTSFWRFRHREGVGRMTAIEYGDFLIELDESISAVSRTKKPRAPEPSEIWV